MSNNLILLDDKFKLHDSSAFNLPKKHLLILEGLELKELEDSNSFQSYSIYYYIKWPILFIPPCISIA